MEKDDDDPNTLVGFPAYLPLSYRIPVLIAFGVFLFGTNLTILIRAGIDVESLLYPSSSSEVTSLRSRKNSTLARPVYAVAVVLLTTVTLGILTFWLSTAGAGHNTSNANWVILLVYAAFLAVLLSPLRLYAHERYRFLHVLRRILVGGIDVTDRFLDIIIADVLTSYAKVFGDVALAGCMLFTSSGSSYAVARNHCSRNIMVPLAIALPYIIRFRQCLIEYNRTGNRSHLANALKYCTAFPVILVSSLQLGRTGEVGTPNTAYISDGRLYQLWIFVCLLNSGYSWWWDITKDWDLTLLTSNPGTNESPMTNFELRSQESKAYGLRENMTFKPTMYYAAILIDLILRMLWSVKLSPHLHGLSEYESGIFTMECLEVLRRWMWIFLRIECEHQRVNSSEGAIALTEFGGVAFSNGPNGKIDQD